MPLRGGQWLWLLNLYGRGQFQFRRGVRLLGPPLRHLCQTAVARARLWRRRTAARRRLPSDPDAPHPLEDTMTSRRHAHYLPDGRSIEVEAERRGDLLRLRARLVGPNGIIQEGMRRTYDCPPRARPPAPSRTSRLSLTRCSVSPSPDHCSPLYFEP